jgi:hypothetical protein
MELTFGFKLGGSLGNTYSQPSTPSKERSARERDDHYYVRAKGLALSLLDADSSKTGLGVS